MDPQLIIFVIESAIRLGIKLNEVLLDSTRDRKLMLPVGELFGDIAEADAAEYFAEHPELVIEGGPYAGLGFDERVEAYKVMLSISRKLEGDVSAPDAVSIVLKLQKFEQHAEGFGPDHPAKRLLGTVVEIGIDYFAANPEAMGKDSSARRIVHGFVLHLDDVEFAEGAPLEIAGDVLMAALQTLEANVTLIDDDERLHALLGGVTSSLIEEIGSAESAGELLARRNLVKRLGSSILRGGAAAFTENIDLFLPGDGTARKLVKSTLDQVMLGIRDKPDLFTNESLELIFQSSLVAVGENAELFSEKRILQELISSTIEAVTDDTGRKLFSEETAAAIVVGALVVVGENVETLIDVDDPRKQLLASATRAIALSLSDELGATGSFESLLSREQLIELTQIVFEEVARNPEALLGDSLNDERRTALAQVIGSVANALGDDPGKLVDGEGLIELTRLAIGVAVRNADGLLQLDDDDPATNLLFKSLQELATAVLESEDPRGLVSRQGFVEIARRVLPVVSANLGPILEDEDPIVQRTVAKALDVANGALQGRIDGANLPILIREMLVQVVWQELDLGDDEQVIAAANDILRAAA